MQKPLTDERFIARAFLLAWNGLGHTRPNPAVGAVVVKGGKVVGGGWHRRAGGDHAEVAALKDAAKRGHSTKGATLYVTLEPCSKPGRVGACTDAIVAAGIKRVVYGAVDPNPTNRGRAKRVLAREGIVCEQIGDETFRRPCRGLIKGFAKHVTTGLPYVTVKLAMSLDGKICDDFGDAKWVSSPAARRQTGKFREHFDAIMVGAETIRRDDPSLLSHGKRNGDLIRVVVTKSGKLPKTAQVFTDGKNRTIVLKVKKSLREALLGLGEMGVTSVLCEGGLKLARSLAEEGLVDEWVTVLAPLVIGSRRMAKAVRIGRSHVYPDEGVSVARKKEF